MSDEQVFEWRRSRQITERIVIEGTLILDAPTSLSNGDDDGLTDITLLTDPREGRALLTGASIAGALRNYLRECWHGYEQEENSDPISGKLSAVKQLFGELDEECEQSYLIVDDSLANPPQDQSGSVLMNDGSPVTRPNTELRDGVRIEPTRRTAADKAKFDVELLKAGTEFPLSFELLISDHKAKDENDTDAPERGDLIAALASALQGFEKGEIYLGGRKRRGYGQCHVKTWEVRRYNLTTKDGLLAWISHDALAQPQQNSTQKEKIADALKEACALTALLTDKDERSCFKLTAKFALDGSLLIRSGSTLVDANGNPQPSQPDVVHLHSKRNGKPEPVVSGTSLAGVLRHRALRIAKTIADDNDKGQANAKRFVELIFGVDMEELKKRNKSEGTDKQPFASRLEVRESVIESNAVHTLIQSRVRIDRFTGGAYEGALFDAAPVFGKDTKAFEISLLLRSPKDSEIGLLLLLLKDLWTGDLAIGGESSVGRGRLRGLSAELTRRGQADWAIKLKADSESKIKHEGHKSDDKERMEFLNGLVETFNKELKG